MPSLIDEHTQFVDSSGAPIVNGKIYIGTQNLNPVSNPITVYSDRGLTTTLSQPVLTDSNGRSTSKIWVPEGKYSIRVDNSADVQQYQELDAGTGDAEVSGYRKAGDVQVSDEDAATTSFAVNTNVTQLAFESVGPTGSGADNIWTELDNLPTSARVIFLQVFISIDSGAGADPGLTVQFFDGDATSTFGLGHECGFQRHADASGELMVERYHLPVPVNSNRVFIVNWETTSSPTVNGINLELKGFVSA